MTPRYRSMFRPAALVAALSTLAEAFGACARTGTTPDAQSPPVASDPSLDPLAPIPADDLRRFGCGDPFVVCVNACTGRLIRPRVAPVVAEGAQLIVRSVGWGSCRPQKVECLVHDVPNVDVGYRGATVPIPNDDGGMSPPPLPPGEPAPPDTGPALTDLRKSMSADGGTPPVKKNLALKEDGGASQSVVTTDDAVKAVNIASTAFKDTKNGRLGSVRLLTAAATDVARSVKTIPAARGDASSDLSCPAAQRAAMSQADGQLQALGQLERYAEPLGSIARILQQRVQDAKGAVTRYKTAASSICSGGDGGAPVVDSSALGQLHEIAQQANGLLDLVEQDARLTARTQSTIAMERQAASFGDCVISVPVGISNRQVVVTVKTTPVDPCVSEPSSPVCSQPQPDGGTSQGMAPVDPDGGLQRATNDALVYVTIDHGQYFWDLGLLFAVVPMGQRTVSTPQAPGVPGTHFINVDERATTLTGVTINAYPLGHRRQAYSFLEGWPRFPNALGDAFGLQLGLNPDLKNATSTVFGGLLFEPITGLSLNAGMAFLQGEFLKSGYAPGMVAPANRGDYVSTSTMMRFYFGATLGFEFVHTTAAQLPVIKNDLSN